MLHVEVLYAPPPPQPQQLYQIELGEGATLREAIEASGALRDFPEIDLARQRVGIFGKLTALDTTLRDHDRVEIYRALVADPKEVRRRRAAEIKS